MPPLSPPLNRRDTLTLGKPPRAASWRCTSPPPAFLIPHLTGQPGRRAWRGHRRRHGRHPHALRGPSSTSFDGSGRPPKLRSSPMGAETGTTLSDLIKLRPSRPAVLRAGLRAWSRDDAHQAGGRRSGGPSVVPARRSYSAWRVFFLRHGQGRHVPGHAVAVRRADGRLHRSASSCRFVATLMAIHRYPRG